MTKEPNPEDNLAKTIASYDQIASNYFVRWKDRSPIEQLARRFISMLKVYGLSKEPVLDVGCGPGFDSAIFRRQGLRTIGLDLSHQMIRIGREHYPGQFVLADMRHLPFVPKVGGLWVAASMLHVPYPDVPATLNNFCRVLLPGGLIFLSVKLGDGAEWSKGPYDVARHFTFHQPQTLNEMLREAGFQIVEGWQTEFLENEPQWLIRFARKPSKDMIKSLDLHC